MSFLNPFLFIALIAAAVPVIIHLINFHKPKKIYFSTLAFFQELQKTTIRRLNLKRYLLLITRILAIMMLVMALARPFMQSDFAGWLGNPQEDMIVSLIIDNGPSMFQIDEAGPYLEQSKQVAAEIIRQSGENARFLVAVTHGERDVVRLMREAEALRVVDRINVVNKGGYLAEALGFMYDRMKREPGTSGKIYWISDGRETQVETLVERIPSETIQDREIPITVIQVGSDGFQNMGIVSIKTDDAIPGAGVPAGVRVGVKNFGDAAVNQAFLSFEVEGERIGQYDLSLEAGEEKEYMFDVIPEATGTLKGRAILEGGPYPFDHVRYMALDVPDRRRVLVISDRGEDGSRRSYIWPAIEAIEMTMPGIEAEMVDASAIREVSLSDYHALIFDGLRAIPDYMHPELVQYVQQGRSILLLPSEQARFESYNQFIGQLQGGAFSGMRGTYGRFEEIASLEPLEEGHDLTDGLFELEAQEKAQIDMPALYHYWRYTLNEPVSGRTLLRSNLDDPLFVKHRVGDGMMVVGALGFDPGWSNISVKPLFSPLFYSMIRYVVSWEYGDVREHILGRPFDRLISFSGEHVLMRIGEEEFYPDVNMTNQGMRLYYPGIEWKPGWLEIENSENKYTIAINQDILESDFRSLSIQETEERLKAGHVPVSGVISASGLNEVELQSVIRSAGFGREIWNIFIWIALAFLVFECIISLWSKREQKAVV